MNNYDGPFINTLSGGEMIENFSEDVLAHKGESWCLH